MALRPKLTHSTVVAYLALFVALGGGAIAATGFIGSDGKIRGCVGKSGNLTVLKSGRHCRNQTPIAWNQRGPKGAPGARGPEGAPGAKGDAGPAATNAAHADTAADADKLDNRDSSTFAPVGSEGWHPASLNDGLPPGSPPGTPVIACNWTPYGGGFSPPGYLRDPAGMVHLRGLGTADGMIPCSSSTAANLRIFTLPAGYRPEADVALTTISNNKAGRINVRTGGSVEIEPGFPAFADVKHWVSLDGLTFRCAPSGQNGCP